MEFYEDQTIEWKLRKTLQGQTNALNGWRWKNLKHHSSQLGFYLNFA